MTKIIVCACVDCQAFASSFCGCWVLLFDHWIFKNLWITPPVMSDLNQEMIKSEAKQTKTDKQPKREQNTQKDTKETKTD